MKSTHIALSALAALALSACSGEYQDDLSADQNEDLDIGQTEEAFVTQVQAGAPLNSFLTGTQISSAPVSGTLGPACINTMGTSATCSVPVTRSPIIRDVQGNCSAAQLAAMKATLDNAINEFDTSVVNFNAIHSNGPAPNATIQCDTGAGSGSFYTGWATRRVTAVGSTLVETPDVPGSFTSLAHYTVVYKQPALAAIPGPAARNAMVHALMPLVGQGDAQVTGTCAHSTLNTSSICIMFTPGQQCRANYFQPDVSPGKYLQSQGHSCPNQ
jgi:hypothetical protein